MAHIQSMLLNGSGMRGSGTGDGEPSPSPLDPMGIDFPPFSSTWRIKSPHPRPLIGEFPTGNRGSGPRCHLESEGIRPQEFVSSRPSEFSALQVSCTIQSTRYPVLTARESKHSCMTLLRRQLKGRASCSL